MSIFFNLGRIRQETETRRKLLLGAVSVVTCITLAYLSLRLAAIHHYRSPGWWAFDFYGRVIGSSSRDGLEWEVGGVRILFGAEAIFWLLAFLSLYATIRKLLPSRAK